MELSGTLQPELMSANSQWVEPPLRPSQPSYRDSPWSGVSSDRNPVLSSMRPLGSMPSAADLRKVGRAATVKPPSRPSHVNTQGPKHAARHENSASGNASRETAPDLASLPLPSSSEYDVGRLKSVVESALHQADDVKNRAVTEGLRRLWMQSATDPFALSVLDSVINNKPGPDQMAAFKTVMRDAFKTSVNSGDPSGPEPITRTRSTASTSSLSSAKSLEVTSRMTSGPGGGAATRGRKRGRNSESLPAAGLSNDTVGQKRPLVGVPGDEQPVPAAKRTRLHDNFPIVARESQIRSSLDLEAALDSPAGNDKDDSGAAELERAGRGKRFARDEALENNDTCRQCQSSGSLLCCDGCINSYHFSCLEPPLDPANPPEGQWFCPSCQTRNSFGALFGNLEKAALRDFQLPTGIRNHYQGVRTGQDGRYQEVMANVRSGPRGRGNRTGRADEQYMTRMFDNKGKLIVCVACGLTSNGKRPIIQCDYCPCSWHMDCVDPPLAIPPTQKAGSDRAHHSWMCPNHIDHELYVVHTENGAYAGKTRIRRPRHPRVIDVDILPSDDEAEKLQEQESQGIVYRVSEHGVKLDFVDRVKRENLEAEMRKVGAEQYSAYARQKMDDLVAQATFWYEAEAAHSQAPSLSDAQAAIVRSRTQADRDAAASLISFATENRDIENLQSDKIDSLVDALLASEPEGAPRAPTELESLHALKELIERRIEKLTSSD